MCRLPLADEETDNINTTSTDTSTTVAACSTSPTTSVDQTGTNLFPSDAGSHLFLTEYLC